MAMNFDIPDITENGEKATFFFLMQMPVTDTSIP